MKNAKFLGYCFYMNTNLLGDFQICISVPLILEATVATILKHPLRLKTRTARSGGRCSHKAYFGVPNLLMVSRIQSPKLKRAEDSTTEKFEKNIKYLPIKIKSIKYFSEGLKYTGYYFVLQSNKMYLHGGSMMIFCNFPKKKHCYYQSQNILRFCHLLS